MLWGCSIEPFAKERRSTESHSCFLALLPNHIVAERSVGPHNPVHYKATTNSMNHSTVFMQSFNKYLLIAYYVPGNVPGAKDINKIRFLPSERFSS